MASPLKARNALLEFCKRASGHLPLRVVLTVPFVLQILISTGLVGYLADRNGQRSVNDLASQLTGQASDRVDQYLDSYLAIPEQINQINADAVELGILDLQDFETVGHYFWNQMQVFPTVSYISYTLPNGHYAGAGRFLDGQGITIDEISAATDGQTYTFATDPQGNRTEVLEILDYDPLEETAFTDPVEAGKPVWSAPYNWDGATEFISIGASYPLYDNEQNLVAVMGVDLLLNNIDEFLQTIQISPSAEIFIMERDGALVSTSVAEQPFQLNGDVAERLNAQNSEVPILRASTQFLINRFGNLRQIHTEQVLRVEVNQERYFLRVMPWQQEEGLDWLVVMAIPEADFMGQINQNRRTTLWLCIATFLITTQVGIWTARWVTIPLASLNRAAKAIAHGQLDQTLDLHRQDELGELAQSFNQMADQLNASFSELQTVNTALTESEHQLQHANQTLEQQVQERTQELSSTLDQLRATQADLIQSEKLAALGQLIAGIAHEVNTPLGAIQASIGNIDHSLTQSLQQMPTLFQTLPADRLADFFALLAIATQPHPLLSSKEERKLRRQLTQTLTEQGIDQAPILADLLSKMGIREGINELLPLLRHPDSRLMLETAYALSSVKMNSQNIQLAVDRASKIVFALKAYIRTSSDGQRSEASIPDSIDTVLTLYHNQLKQGIDIEKTYDDVPPILCYPDDLMQVWANLIINAAQAMNYQGKLAIAVFEQDEELVVQISDNGPGISPELLDKIYQPFFTTKPVGEGSGLGLHIVRQTIEKHQGRLELFSEPGMTIFTVRLPLLED